MANTHRYGFRFLKMRWGGETPEPQTHFISSGYAANTGAAGTGGTAVNLNIGDPVQLVEGTLAVNTAGAGSVRLLPPGNSDTTDDVADRAYGIVVGFPRVAINGNIRPNANYPLGGVTYTSDVNKTLVSVIPVEGAVWEIEVATTSASFDTIQEYEAIIGSTTDILYTPLTASTTNIKANPLISLAFTAANAAFRQVRVLGVGRLGDQIDYASASVPLQVVFNQVQTSPFRLIGGLDGA